jgi:hypothetical protein
VLTAIWTFKTLKVEALFELLKKLHKEQDVQECGATKAK